MKRYFTLAVTFTFSLLSSFAQSVNIHGNTQLEGVYVKISSLTKGYLEGDNYRYVTTSNGKLKFMNVPTGGEFLMSFSKKGYVTKLISFDFTNEQVNQPAQVTFSITMDLESNFDKTDIFYEPICKWKISENNELEFDIAYARKMEKKVQAIKKNITISPNEEIEPSKPWNYTHPDGSREVGTLKKGKLDSSFQFIDKNGLVLKEGQYINGLKNGPWTHYWPNGNIKQECLFDLGVETGVWLFFHCNSTLYSEIIMENGKINSGYNYSILPTTKEIGTYTLFKNNQVVNKEINGLVKIKYRNDNNFLVSNYKNGQKSGTWKWFTETGELVKERTYKEDVLVGEKRFLSEDYLDFTTCDK